MKLSVILLAKTDSESLFQMTMTCISSMLASEKEVTSEIIIIESNKNYLHSQFRYPDFVKVIIPEAAFNFHHFLNIGIQAATGDFIALCNNDLIFHQNWFSEILKVSLENPNILSFSPSGTICTPSQKDTFLLGYRVMIHVKGWCIVVKKEIFNKIGLLDETFDFYYADNDYAMTLKYHNIKHALVYNSYVEHLEKKSTVIENTDNREQEFVKKYQIPEYLKKERYNWVFESEKYLSAIIKYHNKWGNPDFLYRKNKLADIFYANNLGYFVKFFIKIKM